MAQALKEQVPTQECIFVWSGKNRQGQLVHGHMRAANELQVHTSLRQQGIFITRISQRSMRVRHAIKTKDIALFTRQLATMLKAGVPLLQAFDIVGKSNTNPSLGQLLHSIRQDVETGTSLSLAFRKHPRHFDHLYCSIIQAGETAGILDHLLERLALALEKTEAIKHKIQSVLIYPLSVILVALVALAVIMIWVVPAFQDVFAALDADLPLATQTVLAISAALMEHGWLMLACTICAIYIAAQAFKRSPRIEATVDRWLLRLPVWSTLLHQACAARWARTLSTMCTAGVPLVDALDCVGNVAGNQSYRQATQHVRQGISTGLSLTHAMESTRVFPTLLVQMCAIGEASGTLDHMLAKAADFYEQAFDETTARLSSLIEPCVVILLGSIIGGIVVAVYLPVFKLGQIV